QSHATAPAPTLASRRRGRARLQRARAIERCSVTADASISRDREAVAPCRRLQVLFLVLRKLVGRLVRRRDLSPLLLLLLLCDSGVRRRVSQLTLLECFLFLGSLTG